MRRHEGSKRCKCGWNSISLRRLRVARAGRLSKAATNYSMPLALVGILNSASSVDFPNKTPSAAGGSDRRWGLSPASFGAMRAAKAHACATGCIHLHKKRLAVPHSAAGLQRLGLCWHWIWGRLLRSLLRRCTPLR